MSNCIKEQKICQILYILFIYTWLNHTPVNGVLHCKLCFIFNMFENKISLLTSLFESEFDFQSSVLHCKFLLREHFNTKSHYCNHDDVLSWTLWKKKKRFLYQKYYFLLEEINVSKEKNMYVEILSWQ